MDKPHCKTCNDKGIVGGWVGGVEGGYETEECPDCSALDAQFDECCASGQSCSYELVKDMDGTHIMQCKYCGKPLAEE